MTMVRVVAGATKICCDQQLSDARAGQRYSLLDIQYPSAYTGVVCSTGMDSEVGAPSCTRWVSMRK